MFEGLPKPSLKWISDNQVKINPDRYYSILRGKFKRTINIAEEVIESSSSAALVGIYVGNHSKFQILIGNLWSQASTKIHPLPCVTLWMSTQKKRIFINEFFISRFKYCLFISMRDSHMLNSKTNNLLENVKNLCAATEPRFHQLLENDDSVSIYLARVCASEHRDCTL